MRHGMALGADDYLPKPFTIEELYASVEARLRKSEAVRGRTHEEQGQPGERRRRDPRERLRGDATQVSQRELESGYVLADDREEIRR